MPASYNRKHGDCWKNGAVGLFAGYLWWYHGGSNCSEECTMSHSDTPANPPALPSVQLPAVADTTSPMLKALTASLGVSRDVLAADDQIEDAWSRLPKLLQKIPAQSRDERMVRMCIAVATGLFDSAINYAWNAAVVALRDKVRKFGLTVVPQVISKDFDEAKLLDLKDAELLDLCLKLNLITEDGFFVLDQCRDIRNNFSAAHPSMGALDEHEFINFLNRCAKHALANERNPKGVDIQAFIKALKSGRFTDTQLEEWRVRLAETFDAQREILFGMLHGIYCDGASGEEGRVNALAICGHFVDTLTPKTRSDFIDRHQEYRAKGDDARYKASLQFFEKLKLLGLLNTSEVHALISSACKKLMSVHNAFDNFYNEPPFAERLCSLTEQHQVPDSARHEFVEAVLTCAVGNGYGTSVAAMPFYSKMIQSFSPAEIKVLLELPDSGTLVGRRVRAHARCKSKYKEIISLVAQESIPTAVRGAYEKWLKE